MSDLQLGAIAHATDITHVSLPYEGADLSIQAIYGIDANHRFYVTGRGWYYRDPEDITDLTTPDITYYGLADLIPEVFPWLRPILDFHGHDALTGIPHEVTTRSWQTFHDEYGAHVSRDTDDPRSKPLTPYEHLAMYLQCPPQRLKDIPAPGTASDTETYAAIVAAIDALKPAWRQQAAALLKLYDL